MRLSGIGLALVGFLCCSGCKKDACESRPVEAQIDIQLSGINAGDVGTVEVQLSPNNAPPMMRVFTTVPSFVFDFGEYDRHPRTLIIRATALDKNGTALGAGKLSTSFQPNGCNFIVVTVSAGGKADGGLDSGPVVGDGPKPDASMAKECSPACTTGSCCDGICAGLAGDIKNCGKCGKACGATEKCVAGTCKICSRQCADKQCGPDGCGGTCGPCKTTESCDTQTGKCLACAAIAICGSRVCGDDGCGHACGTCKSNELCVIGQCVTAEPDCTGKNCGDPDGADSFCQTGPCLGGGTCSSGKCDATCKPDCAGKDCGNDGCGGSCGACSGLAVCDSTGKCGCTPWCTTEGRQCGPDGCGGVCGTCSTAPNTYCNGFGVCGQQPAVVGCSDGTREGFVDTGAFPTIAACAGKWTNGQNLRATSAGKVCGDPAGGVCVSPADLCSSGWHVCMKNGWPADLSKRISDADCKAGTAGSGIFLAASDLAVAVPGPTAPQCDYTPLPVPCTGGPDVNGSRTVACGANATLESPYCDSQVWANNTPNSKEPCNNTSSGSDATGVLCCKDPPFTGQ